MDIEKAKKRFLPMSETMFYILSSFGQQRHGYGVMLHVKKITAGRLTLGAGTIYQSLTKLESSGLIRADGESQRKKLYSITPLGSEILKCEAERICELYKIAEEVL